VECGRSARYLEGVTDDVPKLPRGRGLRLSRPQMLRIAGTLLLLVFLIAMQRPCADAVSKFVTSFGDQGSASVQMPKPGNVDIPVGSAAGGGSGSEFERLRPDMTEDEIKAVIDRARTRATRGSATP
jgi:hypothetical protein